jgi:hypothetical protein
LGSLAALHRVLTDAQRVKSAANQLSTASTPSVKAGARWFLDSYWAQLTAEKKLGEAVGEEADKRRGVALEERQSRREMYGEVEVAKQLQVLKETLLLLELEESRARSAVAGEYNQFNNWAATAEKSWSSAAMEAANRRIESERVAAEKARIEEERRVREEDERRKMLEMMALEQASAEYQRQEDLKLLRAEELELAARVANKRREMEERLTTLEAQDRQRAERRKQEQREEYEMLLVQEASLQEAIAHKEKLLVEQAAAAARKAEEDRDMQYAALLQQELDLQSRLEEREAEARLRREEEARRKVEEERRLQDERDEAYARLLQEEEAMEAQVAARKSEEDKKAAEAARAREEQLEAVKREERRLKEERLRALEAKPPARSGGVRYDAYGYPIVDKPQPVQHNTTGASSSAAASHPPYQRQPTVDSDWEMVDAPRPYQHPPQQQQQPYPTYGVPMQQQHAQGVVLSSRPTHTIQTGQPMRPPPTNPTHPYYNPQGE